MTKCENIKADMSIGDSSGEFFFQAVQDVVDSKWTPTHRVEVFPGDGELLVGFFDSEDEEDKDRLLFDLPELLEIVEDYRDKKRDELSESEYAEWRARHRVR